MRLLKAACVASLAAAIMVSLGCSTSKPHPADLRVLTKAKKPAEPKEAPEEAEFDDGAIYGGPAVYRRNLPLARTKWAWEGNLSVDGFEVLGDPSHFSLEFKPNGWFDFEADCRHGTGIYEANGPRIVLAVVKASRSACRHGSQADGFISGLEAAKTFRQADSKLYFELKGESKTMVFGLKP
jgi:heat shock protein HslJ